jgi:hypothetical protein
MADNVTPEAVVSSAAFKFRTDDLGGSPVVQAPVSKILLGGDGADDGFVSSSNPLPVSASSLPLPSGASTAAKQPALGVAGTPSADVITVQGATSMTALKVDGSAVTQPVSGSLTTVATVTNLSQLGGAAIAMGTGVRSSGTQRVTIATDDIVPASQSGTWTVGLSAAQTLATVTTVATLTGGGVAHDGVDSGNPLKVGGRAVSTLSTATLVASGDRSDFVTDLDGALVVRLTHSSGDILSQRTSNTDGAATALSTFGATAGTYNNVTAIVVYNSSGTAGFVDFTDGSGGTVLWTMPIPAGGGSVISSPDVLFRTSANTGLFFDVSAALSTVYISVSGHKSKV